MWRMRQNKNKANNEKHKAWELLENSGFCAFSIFSAIIGNGLIILYLE